MKIKKLNIDHFAQFHNLTIELDDGINLIYGENEKGKSTVHKFIEGMFFGFYKPYMKTRQYSDEYYKYKPWEGESYIGSLIYEHEGKTYRIERNFLKGDDEVKIYNENTYEDITSLFEYDDSIKLHKMYKHIGMNDVVFKNTVSISQLSNATANDLAKEVKDSIINFTQTKNNRVSILKAKANLNNKKQEIGTKRAYTKPLGKLNLKLDELKEELKEAKETNKEINSIERKINDISNSLMYQIEEIDEKKKKLKTLKLKDYCDRYKSAICYLDQIKKLKKTRLELEKYNHIDKSKYNELIKRHAEIINIRNNLKELKIERENLISDAKEKKELIVKYKLADYDLSLVKKDFSYLIEIKNDISEYEERISDLQKKIDKKEDNLEDVKKDYNTYNVLREEIQLLSEKEHNININIEKNNIEIGKIQKKTNKNKIIRNITFIACIIGIGLGLISWYLFSISFVSALIFIIEIIDYKKKKPNYNEKIKDLTKEEEKLSKIDEKIKNKKRIAKDILDKYKVNTGAGLLKLYDSNNKRESLEKSYRDEIKRCNMKIIENENKIKDIEIFLNEVISLRYGDNKITKKHINELETEFNDYSRIKNEVNENKKDIESIDKKRKELVKKHKGQENEYRSILKENDCKSLKEYKEAFEKKNKYDSILNSIKNKEELLLEVLKDMTIEQLKEKAIYYEKLDSKIIINKKVDVDYLSLEIENEEKEIRKNREQKVKYEERRDILEKNSKEVYLIENELSFLKSEMERYEKRLKSIDFCIEILDKASLNMQSEFAPELNKKTCRLVNKVTDGRYSEIKINPMLQISIKDEKTKKMIDIENLSMGTIDQMYFAMRFAIADIIIKDKNIPFILDDSFINYDKTRLKNLLESIVKIRRKDQFLIFTCHEREKEIIKTIGAKYKLINLSN